VNAFVTGKSTSPAKNFRFVTTLSSGGKTNSLRRPLQKSLERRHLAGGFAETPRNE
jgi:hypothetical protein